ncbi:hypothetical protein DPMN_025127 [Dreissena polymorpha]|uniref:Uncharacterized protein n=1 Tax=Dreissena polymorpha TaxID=45954 RepID=A0A9D4LNR2_DREPO|nr:hypothetical protein DPMN_025127 [Dreissena polymorpha]
MSIALAMHQMGYRWYCTTSLRRMEPEVFHFELETIDRIQERYFVKNPQFGCKDDFIPVLEHQLPVPESIESATSLFLAFTEILDVKRVSSTKRTRKSSVGLLGLIMPCATCTQSKLRIGKEALT